MTFRILKIRIGGSALAPSGGYRAGSPGPAIADSSDSAQPLSVGINGRASTVRLAPLPVLPLLYVTLPTPPVLRF